MIVSALFVNVLAQSNPYDKYRNRTYSNKGYLSEDDELKLAEQVHQELLKQTRLVQDRSINEYVNSVGQRLARNSERPDIPWRFYVVDDKSINAFATLGGRVYVHTGLLAATNSESQLASVLGHEIGHIVGRHGLENVKKSQRARLVRRACDDRRRRSRRAGGRGPRRRYGQFDRRRFSDETQPRRRTRGRLPGALQS